MGCQWPNRRGSQTFGPGPRWKLAGSSGKRGELQDGWRKAQMIPTCRSFISLSLSLACVSTLCCLWWGFNSQDKPQILGFNIHLEQTLSRLLKPHNKQRDFPHKCRVFYLSSATTIRTAVKHHTTTPIRCRWILDLWQITFTTVCRALWSSGHSLGGFPRCNFQKSLNEPLLRRGLLHCS